MTFVRIVRPLTDPLACANPACGHPIEDHHPGEYNRDACVGAGYEQPYGTVCKCEGFALLRASLPDVKEAMRRL